MGLPAEIPRAHHLDGRDLGRSAEARLLPTRFRHLLPSGMRHSIGDLAEVLDNLGVFRAAPQNLVELCPSGFRRVPISTGSDYYLALQGLRLTRSPTRTPTRTRRNG